MHSIVRRKIAYILGSSNVDINCTTKCNDSPFSFSTIPQLSYASNDFLLVCSLPRGIFIPPECPHVRTALAVQLKETSLLISVHIVSLAFSSLFITADIDGQDTCLGSLHRRRENGDRHATFSKLHDDRSGRSLWQTGVPSHHRRPQELGAEVHQGHMRREEAQHSRSARTERRLLRRLPGTPTPTAGRRHGSTVSYTNFRVARKYAYNEFGGENADCNAGRRAGRLDSAENAR